MYASRASNTCIGQLLCLLLTASGRHAGTGSHLNDSIVAAWPYDETGKNQFSTSYFGVYSQTSWAKIQQFYLGHENSHRRSRWGARTIPLKLMRNINWHMMHVSVIWLIEPCNQKISCAYAILVIDSRPRIVSRWASSSSTTRCGTSTTW